MYTKYPMGRVLAKCLFKKEDNFYFQYSYIRQTFITPPPPRIKNSRSVVAIYFSIDLTQIVEEFLCSFFIALGHFSIVGAIAFILSNSL